MVTMMNERLCAQPHVVEAVINHMTMVLPSVVLPASTIVHCIYMNVD
jgi:hypothetical protein